MIVLSVYEEENNWRMYVKIRLDGTDDEQYDAVLKLNSKII